METEIWKDIEGYEGLYQVSNMGRVRGLCDGEEKIIKQQLRGSRENNKYRCVDLGKKRYSTHRLVAQAFIPNPNNLPQVNHKDENKLNNCADNLEWCDQSYNIKYSYDSGAHKSRIGEEVKTAKLTNNEVRWIRKNYIYTPEGEKTDKEFSLNKLAKIFGVSKRTMLDIVHNKKYAKIDNDLPIKYKFFCYGDVHGHYTELRKALDEAGFNITNPLHKLIDLSDTFDRGTESLTLYEWYRELGNKIVVLNGNHFPMLAEYLDGSSETPFNYLYNGVNESLASFLHCTMPFETWCMFGNIESPTYGDFATWIKEAREQINEEYPELLPWLKNMPYFFETKNHIFTHASIDLDAEDWHKPHCTYHRFRDWEALTWDEGNFINKKNTTGKSIVVGHFSTGQLREMWNLGNSDDYSILKTDDNKYFLDAATIITKKINVLVVEDELLYEIDCTR